MNSSNFLLSNWFIAKFRQFLSFIVFLNDSFHKWNFKDLLHYHTLQYDLEELIFKAAVKSTKTVSSKISHCMVSLVPRPRP